jgi:hypothetical protein
VNVRCSAIPMLGREVARNWGNCSSGLRVTEQLFPWGTRDVTHMQQPDRSAANNMTASESVALTSRKDPERAMRAWLVKTSLGADLSFFGCVVTRARRNRVALASDLTTPNRNPYELANGVNQRQNPAPSSASGCRPSLR